VRPCAESWSGGDGPVGVLLIHGFTGSPYSMRGWGERLAAEGYTVSVPRLPGHGTSWQELALTGWQDWYACAEREFLRLSRRCEQVFVGGLSMGGSLALLLAERHGAAVSGLVLVNPVVTSTDRRLSVLPVLHRFVASLGGIANDIAKPGVDECGYGRIPLSAMHSMTGMWAEIRSGLAAVDQPLLLFRSVEDHVVDPTSGAAILAETSCSDIEEHLLVRSYHVATLDHEAEDIEVGSMTFFRRLTKD
jgi:carboxylesterase